MTRTTALLLFFFWLVSSSCSSSTESVVAVPVKQRSLPDVSGDVAAGKEIFYRKQAPKCWICHAVGNEQERAGPNLHDVGGRNSREELLDSLLNPTRKITDGFTAEIIESRSRGLVIGVVAREQPSLLVRNEFGDEIELPADDVVSRRASDLSMMPDNLTDALSDQELVDLLAFLGSLRD